MTSTTDVYLCMLDNVFLTVDEIALGNMVIRKIPPAELAMLLHCCSIDDLSSIEQGQMESYSLWPWAVLQKEEVEMEGSDDADVVMMRMLHQYQLAYAHVGGNSYWPFDSLIRTLNVLKPSDGPVMPIQYYHRTPEAMEGTAEVQRIIRSEPAMTGDERDEWPLLQSYSLHPDDVDHYLDLEHKLNAALRDDTTEDVLPSAHIWIADEYFERGNRSMLSHSDRILTVLMFEFALEALYIGEEERQSQRMLRSRVPTALCPESPLLAERLGSFLGEVFWIRSKAAHGIRPIPELMERIRVADTQGLFCPSRAFGGLLANLREVVRQSIRFFIDKHAHSVARDTILEGLDSEPGPS